MFRAVCLFALLSLVVCEPPARFRSRAGFGVQRTNSRFARLEEMPAQEQPSAGYDYPKPMSSGYHYPKPDQAFPLPGEEMPPAFTTEAVPETTTAAASQEPDATTTAAYEDYEEATAAQEPAPAATPKVSPAAKLRRRQQLIAPAALRQIPARQRLEEAPVDGQQQPLRPVYLINLPDAALQQLVLLNNAQLASLQVAPQPAAYYVPELEYIYKKK